MQWSEQNPHIPCIHIPLVEDHNISFIHVMAIGIKMNAFVLITMHTLFTLP